MDESGKVLTDVRLKMDGQPLASRLEGGAVAVDPGVREFTFEADNKGVAAIRVVIAQGQRDRSLSVVLHASAQKTSKVAKPASGILRDDAAARQDDSPSVEIVQRVRPAAGLGDNTGHLEVQSKQSGLLTATSLRTPPVASRASVAPYLSSMVGVAGLGGYGVLTYLGRKENSRMVAACPPDCSQSRVTHIRTLYFAADVSLGAGIVALGAATWLFLQHGSARRTPSRGAGYAFGIQPMSAGAVATVAGSL
jgi:hypothetical protein